ncbi:uncharacterized protein LOC123499090 [Portunus trituberculatus]|uniref:uncharacterized protein LOC123499090 n=1 Tax=Portunus trituberculatus TaxID=210409 RepID=UPI001E1CEA50|nr:uncharacterized protein LOC123499090 [Portunus trituberculatus]
MSVAPFLLSRPIYSLNNVISTSILARDTGILKSIVDIVLPVTIFLDNYVEQVYYKKKGDSDPSRRSLGEEQFGAYGMIAGRLANQFGVDGPACVQRFMCELQQRPIHKRTMVGMLLTLLFTPNVRNKRDADLLTEYLTARKLGKSGAYCHHHYAACPVSVFHFFDNLRNTTNTWF